MEGQYSRLRRIVIVKIWRVVVWTSAFSKGPCGPLIKFYAKPLILSANTASSSFSFRPTPILHSIRLPNNSSGPIGHIPYQKLHCNRRSWSCLSILQSKSKKDPRNCYNMLPLQVTWYNSDVHCRCSAPNLLINHLRDLSGFGHATMLGVVESRMLSSPLPVSSY